MDDINVDFTREPIIETIITPKEGCKLVIRSSKSAGQEEYFADSVEIVSFGHSLFFRSLERPKAFLAPVNDFEVLEVREARMVLKNAGFDRSIKIGGGRDTPPKPQKEKPEASPVDRPAIEANRQESSIENVESTDEAGSEVRLDKKRDRRRNYRKRRGRDDKDETKDDGPERSESSSEENGSSGSSVPRIELESGLSEESQQPPPLPSVLLQPPPMLISETIARYRQNEEFKSAFYLTEEDQYKPHDRVQDLLDEDDNETEKSSSGESETGIGSSDPQELENPIFSEIDASSERDEKASATFEPFREERHYGDAALSLFAEEEGGSREEETIFSPDYNAHTIENLEDLPPPPPQKKENEHPEHL